MLTNVTTPLLGVVATAAIGRLGQAPLLGGVAMASVAFDSLFWLFGFLRMGTVAFTAQALGAGDTREQSAELARALIVAAALGLAARGGSDEVTAAAREYFFVRAWSAPFALGIYVMLGWLVGRARARIAMAVQIAINVINMIAMVTLVLVLDMGLTGAALASVIAEICGLAFGLVIAWRIAGARFDLSWAIVFDRDRLRHMLAVNRDIMIRTAGLIAAYLFFIARGARAGDVTLAANAVLNNFTLVG